MTWEQFSEMFRTEYASLVQRERLDHEYLSLKQTTDLVKEITNMFIERSLFYPEYAASKHVQISCYLSMIKTEIREFVSTQWYSFFSEL